MSQISNNPCASIKLKESWFSVGFKLGRFIYAKGMALIALLIFLHWFPTPANTKMSICVFYCLSRKFSPHDSPSPSTRTPNSALRHHSCTASLNHVFLLSFFFHPVLSSSLLPPHDTHFHWSRCGFASDQQSPEVPWQLGAWCETWLSPRKNHGFT